MILSDKTATEWPKDTLFVWVAMGKGAMFAFDASNAEFALAANFAITRVGKKHELQLFHQIGHSNLGSGNDAGFHGWETWMPKTAADLDALLPELNAELEHTFEVLRR